MKDNAGTCALGGREGFLRNKQKAVIASESEARMTHTSEMCV